MFEVGDEVRVARDNDNEGYDDFRNETLIITYVSRNRKDHPGYDEGMGGMALYDLKRLDGTPIGSSLYEYELEPA